MRDLIKKILQEDFDWTDQAKAFELGDFKEEDVSFDDKNAKVYLGEDGKVIYNLTMEELIKYAYNDAYDYWTLETLISNNGNDNGYYYGDDYIDSDEINYIGYHFDSDQLERLEKVLLYVDTKYNLKHKTVKQYIDEDEFDEIGDRLYKLYTGTWDWVDFRDSVLSAIGRAIDKNRWEFIGTLYKKTLQDHNVKIYSYNDDDINVQIPFPYRDNHNLSETLSLIGLDDYSWNDTFYEEWELDTSGSEEDIQFAFNQMINKYEEVMDGEL